MIDALAVIPGAFGSVSGIQTFLSNHLKEASWATTLSWLPAFSSVGLPTGKAPFIAKRVAEVRSVPIDGSGPVLEIKADIKSVGGSAAVRHRGHKRCFAMFTTTMSILTSEHA